MLKLAITALFLGATLTGFSQEGNSHFQENMSDEDVICQYVGIGNGYLLLQDYAQALEKFDIALTLLENANEPVCPVSFLIYFGQAIAYDNLGMRDQTKQALGSMFLAGFALQDEEEDSEDELFSEEDEEFFSMLKELAALAHSPDIRRMLVELVTDLED